MYLFIVFCKDLLCIPFPFWLKDFHLCVYIFCFPPSHTLFSILLLGLVDLRISVFHLAFTNFDSYDAPLSGLRVIGYMFYGGVSIWSLSSTPHFALMCFVFPCVGDFYVTLGISAKPAIMHNCALTIFNRPEWVVDAIWSNGSIEVWSNPTWFNGETNHPADEKGVLSEIGNETGSNGRIEGVCCFCVLFCLFAKSRFYLINKWKSLKNYIQWMSPVLHWSCGSTHVWRQRFLPSFW